MLTEAPKEEKQNTGMELIFKTIIQKTTETEDPLDGREN